MKDPIVIETIGFFSYDSKERAIKNRPYRDSIVFILA